MNKSAQIEVLNSIDKTSYCAVVKEKHGSKRQNTATSLFEKTGGQHHLLLDHERAEKAKKDEMTKRREEKKNEQEE